MGNLEAMMLKRTGPLLAAVLLALWGAGCDGGATLPPLTQAEQQAALSAPAAAPRIQSGDRIRVTVFGEDRLTGDYEVDPGGAVSLPLAGTIRVADMTKAEAEAELTRKFRTEYLRNPNVTVDIASFRPFYILGEVEKPGEYQFKSGLNVFSAMAIAGGQTYRANRNRVLIQRSGETRMREYSMSSAIPVQPGDLIRVPERFF